MFAKSAPQLFAIPVRTTPLRLHATLLVLAIAILALGAGWLAGDIGGEPDQPVVQAPAEQVVPEQPIVEQAKAPASTPRESVRYRKLSQFLAKRYKVSQAYTLDLVTIAHAAGQQVGLDPLLIIAVMAVESRFNPSAESVVGAKGLMQVIPRFHSEKVRELGGEQYAVFDPETNILVGSRVLKEYFSRTGSITSALQMYVGAPNDEGETYTEKIMTEKQRLQQVLGNSAPPPKSITAEAPGKQALAFAQ
jgi:Transglycosylase SLT domain